VIGRAALFDLTCRMVPVVAWTERDLPALDGQRALVTGANSGIGYATASALAAAGARVVLACRSADRGAAAADRIRRGCAGADVRPVVLDLASLRAVHELAEGWDGPLDLLVNNAGVMASRRRQVTVHGFE
jgi:NAD(P)-dependent dehydrogenase (short-subunit alcohol dehydrogenase family)